MNIDKHRNLLHEETKNNELRYDYCVGSSDDGDYDDECKATFDQYRCKGCSFYDTCFHNEVAAEIESDMLHRAMQGETLEKIFGGRYVHKAETTEGNDVPF